MKKNIGIIVPHKGLGDIIYHNSFIESIFKHHKKKIILFTNKSTKANFIYKKNKYIKKIVLIDLHRPFKILYLFKIIEMYLIINKFKFENIYYTGNHKWQILTLKILSIINKIELNYPIEKKKFIINSLKHFLKKIKIDYHINFNINIKEEISKRFINKIINKKKPWIFLNIDTSEDQIKIPNKILFKIINKLKKKYKTIFINTSYKNSYKLSFLKEKKIIKTSSFNIIEIYYIIKRSSLYVGSESGPASIASILNKKSIIFKNEKVLIESSILPKGHNREYINLKKVIKKDKMVLDLI